MEYIVQETIGEVMLLRLSLLRDCWGECKLVQIFCESI